MATPICMIGVQEKNCTPLLPFTLVVNFYLARRPRPNSNANPWGGREVGKGRSRGFAPCLVPGRRSPKNDRLAERQASTNQTKAVQSLVFSRADSPVMQLALSTFTFLLFFLLVLFCSAPISPHMYIFIFCVVAFTNVHIPSFSSASLLFVQ